MKLFYALRYATRQFLDYMKYPRWSTQMTGKLGSHKHICLAFRLFNASMFESVCPMNPVNALDIECSDMCDKCPYFVILEYIKSGNIKPYMDIEFTNLVRYKLLGDNKPGNLPNK